MTISPARAAMSASAQAKEEGAAVEAILIIP
jgi:hypothetical protein